MHELCLILIYIAIVYAFLFVLMPTIVSILFFLQVCMHVFILAFMLVCMHVFVLAFMFVWMHVLKKIYLCFCFLCVLFRTLHFPSCLKLCLCSWVFLCIFAFFIGFTILFSLLHGIELHGIFLKMLF